LSAHPFSFFFLTYPPPPRSTLFPYTTLFRSLTHDYDGGPGLRCSITSAVRCRAERGVVAVVGVSNPRAALRNTFASSISRTSARDRKSTRLNSSHVKISYAVFCLKKKKKKNE